MSSRGGRRDSSPKQLSTSPSNSAPRYWTRPLSNSPPGDVRLGCCTVVFHLPDIEGAQVKKRTSFVRTQPGKTDTSVTGPLNSQQAAVCGIAVASVPTPGYRRAIPSAAVESYRVQRRTPELTGPSQATTMDEKGLPQTRRFSAVGFCLTAIRVWQWSSSFFVYGSFSVLYDHIQRNRLGENGRMKNVELLVRARSCP